MASSPACATSFSQGGYCHCPTTPIIMSPLPRQVSQLLLAPTSYLFFPFLTSSAPDQNAQNPRGHDHQRSTSSSSGTGNAASLETDRSPPPRSSSSSSTPLPPSPVEFDTNAAIALAFLLGSATALGASSVYRRFFKRIKSAEWITPDSLKRKRWITGVVTRCVLSSNQHPPIDL